MALHHDSHWPRASSIFTKTTENADLAIIGVGASQTAITPNQADLTPDAIRKALSRYSTYKLSRKIDISQLQAIDFGNVDSPDDQTLTTNALVKRIKEVKNLVILGGDNSITFSGVRALSQSVGGFGKIGLITLDAHFDVRDGVSNGSPIRQLVEAGLPGTQIVQIGISDFANSAYYAKRVEEYGITVISREVCAGLSTQDIAKRALATVSDCDHVYLDIDVDVCDRAIVPAAPAALPGGFTAYELRELVFELASASKVRTFDIAEIDAAIDSPDERTVRLAALLVLEIAAAKTV